MSRDFSDHQAAFNRQRSTETQCLVFTCASQAARCPLEGLSLRPGHVCCIAVSICRCCFQLHIKCMARSYSRSHGERAQMRSHLFVVKPVRELDHGEVRGDAQGIGGIAARIEHLLPPACTLATAVACASPLYSASLCGVLKLSQVMPHVACRSRDADVCMPQCPQFRAYICIPFRVRVLGLLESAHARTVARTRAT